MAVLHEVQQKACEISKKTTQNVVALRQPFPGEPAFPASVILNGAAARSFCDRSDPCRRGCGEKNDRRMLYKNGINVYLCGVVSLLTIIDGRSDRSSDGEAKDAPTRLDGGTNPVEKEGFKVHSINRKDHGKKDRFDPVRHYRHD